MGQRLSSPASSTFYYAHHDGGRWVSHTIGRWNQVERWFTADEGRTWTTRRLTTGFTKFVSRIHALDF